MLDQRSNQVHAVGGCLDHQCIRIVIGGDLHVDHQSGLDQLIAFLVDADDLNTARNLRLVLASSGLTEALLSLLESAEALLEPRRACLGLTAQRALQNGP